MKVSIVIPTFNRAGMFAHTLPALRNQAPGDFTYEVIFVSNGSTDATASILEAAAAEPGSPFRYFRIDPTGGPSAPRNLGIRAATGEIVIILDDDVAPHPDLVLRHVQFHREHPAPHEAAVGQTYVPDRLRGDPMSLFHDQYSYDRLNNAERLTFFDFWTCNVSFKRQFMLDHGMFDERILLMEDVEVAHRLEQAGMHLYYLPAARGEHLHEATPATLTARAFALGRSVYELTNYIPAPLVKKRFGMVSTGFGVRWFVSRLVRLVAFFLLDNPLTRLVLRLLGGAAARRSPITDAYYGLIFRRAFFTGYYRSLLNARGKGA